MSTVLALVIGVGVGVVVGALGAGGGILSVPVLVYLLGQSLHEAASGSLVIVLVTALVSLPSRARHHQVRWRDGALFGLLSSAGAWTGSWLNSLVDGQVLMLLFSVLLLVVAALMARRALAERRTEAPTAPTRGRPEAPAVESEPATPEEPSSPSAADLVDEAEDAAEVLMDIPWEAQADATAGTTTSVPGPRGRRLLLVVLVASATGLLTGFFGVGGGFVVVPVLLLVLRCGTREAAGTSLLVMVVAALVSLAQRASDGLELDWATVLFFTLGSASGGVLGGPLSQRLRPSTLTALFALLLTAVAVFSLVGTL